MDYDQILNILPNKSLNNTHQLSHMASQANKDMLCYHQAIKVTDSAQFCEAISKEVNSFKKEKIFDLSPLRDKPPDRSLIPFA